MTVAFMPSTSGILTVTKTRNFRMNSALSSSFSTPGAVTGQPPRPCKWPSAPKTGPGTCSSRICRRCWTTGYPEKIRKYQHSGLLQHMLRTGWTLGSPQLMRVLQCRHPRLPSAPPSSFAGALEETKSGYGGFLCAAFQSGAVRKLFARFSRAPFVTILTDLADYPPHFWIERQAQYVICGTDKAVSQARAMGPSPSQDNFPRFGHDSSPSILRSRA